MVARRHNLVIDIDGGTVCVDISTSKYPSTVIYLDEADLVTITESPRRWYAWRMCGQPYAVRRVGSGSKAKTELLHRVLLGLDDPDIFGDHRDGDTLNYCRYNLRAATPRQNSRNMRSHKGSTSKYLGVSWCVRDSIWRAYATIDGVRRPLGSFHKETDAACAYDEAVRHDEFANLNFPQACAA